MKYSSVVSFIFAVISVIFVTTSTHGATPREAAKTRSTNNLPFHPCRAQTKMAAPVRKRLTKLTISVVSICGLRVVTSVAEKWGSGREIALIRTRVSGLVCFGIRTMFVYSGDQNGRLSKAQIANGSEVYDNILKYYRAVIGDTSMGSKICTRSK